MDLENIMLNEISQKNQEPYDFAHVWDIKLKATNEKTRKTKQQKLRHRQ